MLADDGAAEWGSAEQPHWRQASGSGGVAAAPQGPGPARRQPPWRHGQPGQNTPEAFLSLCSWNSLMCLMTLRILCLQDAFLGLH